MTTVYLIRHAEAEGNVYRRVHGQYDALLTTKAWKQLPHLADRFADVPLDAVYASHLYRARNTAHAIAERHNMPVRIRRALCEINMGDWEDLMWVDLSLVGGQAFEAWDKRPWACTVPNGEHVLNVADRFLPAMQRVIDEHPNQTIAIVAHGSVIRAGLRVLLGLAPEEVNQVGWADNTCVAKLECENGTMTPIYWNDASHLPQELSTFASIGWVNNRGVPESVQVHFRAYDPASTDDQALLLDWAHQTYLAAYGTDAQLDESAFLAETAQMAQTPRAVSIGMYGDRPICLVRLAVDDNSEPELGKVGTFYLHPDFRGSGVNLQMLGQAISVYRNMGKQWLCAYVGAHNARAQGFYNKNGFENRGAVERACGTHNKMCKPIAVPTLEEESAWLDLSNLDG